MTIESKIRARVDRILDQGVRATVHAKVDADAKAGTLPVYHIGINAYIRRLIAEA